MTARKNGGVPAFLAGLALALAFALAVLATLVWCVGTHDGLMARWMLETAPPGASGLPAEAYRPLCSALCSYLRGGTPVFDFALEGVPVFGTRETLHLADCVSLFRLARRLMIGGWIAAGVLLGVLLLLRRPRSGARGLLTGTLLVTGAVAAAAVWGALDFGGLFTAFHRLAFTNDLWLMNPATDLIIRLMPTAFFVRYALLIGGVWLLAEAAAACLAAGLLRRTMPPRD